MDLRPIVFIKTFEVPQGYSARPGSVITIIPAATAGHGERSEP